MKFKNFKNGRSFSIGMELELRILHAKDFSFANEYEYFKSNISSKYKKYITPELLQSMIEINTPVFENFQQLEKFLKGVIDELNKIAKRKNLILHTSGANTLEQKNIKIVENKRYKKICDIYGALMDEFFICGTHIHVGFEDFNKALKAYNFSLKYLPMFVAIGANSPFFNGKNTKIHSYRTKIFDRLSRASIPQYFNSYKQMKKCYDILYETGSIESAKDIWWDIRIQDRLKTIEFRIVDGINDFDRLEILVGLARGISILAQKKKYEKMFAQVLKENMWNATRYSMDANFIQNGKKEKIRKAILDLVDELYLENIVDKSFVKKAQKVVKKPSMAQKMLKKYEKSKDLKEVAKMGILK